MSDYSTNSLSGTFDNTSENRMTTASMIRSVAQWVEDGKLPELNSPSTMIMDYFELNNNPIIDEHGNIKEIMLTICIDWKCE